MCRMNDCCYCYHYTSIPNETFPRAFVTNEFFSSFFLPLFSCNLFMHSRRIACALERRRENWIVTNTFEYSTQTVGIIIIVDLFFFCHSNKHTENKNLKNVFELFLIWKTVQSAFDDFRVKWKTRKREIWND